MILNFDHHFKIHELNLSYIDLAYILNIVNLDLYDFKCLPSFKDT